MAMTEVETELDSRYDDIDVESILARCQKGPITFSKRCLYQAPEFIKRLPSTEEVEEGTTVTFACKVVGFPNPTVTWYKEDDVIKPDARAQLEADIDSGIHSIKFADISKCDAGIYKIRASNLEGSSTSMLYISVKGRSKMRNRKKVKRARQVACPPLFPAIIEHVAEEQREMLEIELQPESPLTPIYCTISRKEPVMWPAFLGDWAYSADDILHRDEIDDVDDVEDVFEDENTASLTFVSSAYAQMINKTNEGIVNTNPNELRQTESEINDKTKHTESFDDSGNEMNDKLVKNTYIDNFHKVAEVKDDTDVTSLKDKSDKTSSKDADLTDIKIKCDVTDLDDEVIKCDKINNNDKYNPIDDNATVVKTKHSGQTCYEHNYHQTEVKQAFVDPETVSVIAVHRSYAKGDSTSSAARRSPSPLSRSRNPMTFGQTGRKVGANKYGDTSTLQNWNNERILMRMNKQVPFSNKCFAYIRSLASTRSWEDYLLELLIFIFGSTFLALYFDIPPTTFVFDILVAMFVKLVLTEVLGDS